jgi:PIN domain nuclease of toxin-antitoxin system
VIDLDTHVLIWLYEGAPRKLSPAARDAVENRTCRYAPMVRLELQFMFEIGRNAADALTVLNVISNQFGIEEANTDFSRVVDAALKIGWTRDPFDRLIAAHAIASNARLVTKDSLQGNCMNDVVVHP